jgi:hypothetical protein
MMDIPRAMAAAKQWNRQRRGAMGVLLEKKMIVDDIHRVRLVVEVLHETEWLNARLSIHNPYDYHGHKYTSKDMGDLIALLEVVKNIPCGEELKDGRS